MPFIIDAGIWSSVFAVPSVVVDHHIKLCSPLSLKILLLLFRHAGTPVDTAWISARLNLPAPDISDALNYWIGAGIIAETAAAAQTPAIAHPNASATVVQPQPALPTAPALITSESCDEQTGQKVTTLSARPRVSRADIAEMTQQHPPLGQLLVEAQEVLGEPLTAVDSEIIATLFSYYKFDPGVILMLLQYCVSIEKPSMRYVEKVAASWFDLNITTHEQAEQEILRLTQNNENEKLILRAFRMQGRGLTALEKKYIADWFALGLDSRLLCLACEATLDKTGKVSFAYAGKIISAWKEKQITTIAAAVEDLKNSSGKKAVPQNRSAQTSGSSIDKDELRDLIDQQFFGKDN